MDIYTNIEKQTHTEHMVSWRECWTCFPSAYPQISEPWGKVGRLLWTTGIKCKSEFLMQYKSKSNESKAPLCFCFTPVLATVANMVSQNMEAWFEWRGWDVRNSEEKRGQGRKKGCATSNSEYLRVKSALQFFPSSRSMGMQCSGPLPG